MTGERMVAVDVGGYGSPTLGDVRRLVRYAELVDMDDAATVYTRVRKDERQSLCGLGLRQAEPSEEPS